MIVVGDENAAFAMIASDKNQSDSAVLGPDFQVRWWIIYEFSENTFDVLLPPRCVFCSAILKSGKIGVCMSCIENLPYVKKNELPKIEFVDEFTSLFKYQASVRDSILRYKFDGRSVYATTYAHILAENIRENLGGKFNLITWVPLSNQRLDERGYDQAMLIAMATALDLNDVAVETLRKSTHTEPQSSKGGLSERKANISGAYELQIRSWLRARGSFS